MSKASTLREAGKIARSTFEGVIAPRLGRERLEVLVGPRHGVDTGIIDIGAGRVMAVTADPFFVEPAFGWERAAWFAVHIVASDAATSGLPPTYFTVDLNLPPSMPEDHLAALWDAVHITCADIGMSIVTGHTARYDGCAFPTIGGATVMAIGDKERYVIPAMAVPGDRVLMTKGAAIETAALLGVAFGDRIAAALGTSTARAAEELFYSMTVVPDAAAAVQIGVRDAGVTGMHDATERGVLGGLVEIAESSGTGMVVHRNAIHLRPEIAAICSLFDVDLYSASSEGTLLLTCRPHAAPLLRRHLHEVGIPVWEIGEVSPPDEGMRLVVDGRERPLATPRIDPFWPAYRRALENPAWPTG